MSLTRPSRSLVLMAAGPLGCQRVESVTPLGQPTKLCSTTFLPLTTAGPPAVTASRYGLPGQDVSIRHPGQIIPLTGSD